MIAISRGNAGRVAGGARDRSERVLSREMAITNDEHEGSGSNGV